LLFNEIEDGINPEIVEKLVDLPISTPQQIIITTYSPILLNYIEDGQAKKSVIFTYKNKPGITQQRPFFTTIKGIAEKSIFQRSFILTLISENLRVFLDFRHRSGYF